MKKLTTKKLALSKTDVARLDTEVLARIRGGIIPMTLIEDKKTTGGN